MFRNMFVLLSVMCNINANYANDITWQDESLSKPVCEAVRNRWLADVDGEVRLQMAGHLKKSPIIIDHTTNNVLCSFSEKFVFFRLGILRLEGRGKFREYDLAFAAVEEKGRIFLIENDEEAVKFINAVSEPVGCSMSRAISNISVFAELRGYKLATEEILKLVSRRISDREADRVSKWTMLITKGVTKDTIVVTFAVHLNPEYEIIRCKRYFFEFSSKRQMRLVKIEDAGSIGGYK
jgi:hypothetical protein